MPILPNVFKIRAAGLKSSKNSRNTDLLLKGFRSVVSTCNNNRKIAELVRAQNDLSAVTSNDTVSDEIVSGWLVQTVDIRKAFFCDTLYRRHVRFSLTALHVSISAHNIVKKNTYVSFNADVVHKGFAIRLVDCQGITLMCVDSLSFVDDWHRRVWLTQNIANP